MTGCRALRERLLGGQSGVVHYRGGLGPVGPIAGGLPIELGEVPLLAFGGVRAARAGAVETREQELYALECFRQP